MKSGTKVSYGITKGTYAPRAYGIFVGDTGDGGYTIVGQDNPNAVHPAVVVPSDRVAEVGPDEKPEEHEARLRKEAAAAEIEKHKANPAVQAALKSIAAASAAIVLFIGLVFSASAGPNNSQAISETLYPYWSGGSTNGGSTLSWVIVPAHSSVAGQGSVGAGPGGANGAVPVVTSIDATTDKLLAHVQTYKVIETAVCSFTNTTVSIPIGGNGTNTGTKWDSGTIVVRHLLDDTYEKRSLATSGGQTNVEVTAATLGAVVPGDILYKVSTTGGATFTMTTNSVAANGGLSYVRLQGEALVVGQPNMPLLMEVDGTGANATLNCATAKYVPQFTSVVRVAP